MIINYEEVIYMTKEERTRIALTPETNQELAKIVTQRGEPVTKKTMTAALRRAIIELEERLGSDTQKP